MAKIFFILGALSAFIGVAAGAFGAHGLEGRMNAERLKVFEVGARYGEKLVRRCLKEIGRSHGTFTPEYFQLLDGTGRGPRSTKGTGSG